MTSSVVAVGGAPTGALVAPRGKEAPVPADSAFAQALGDAHASAVVTGVIARSSDPSDDSMVAWRSSVDGPDGDAAAHERALRVEPSNPHEAWTTLAMAWFAANAVPDEDVVVEGGRDRGAGTPTASGDQRLEIGVMEPVTANPADVAAPLTTPLSAASAAPAPVGNGAEVPASTASAVARPTPQSDQQRTSAQHVPAAGVGPTMPVGEAAPDQAERATSESRPAPDTAPVTPGVSEAAHTSQTASAVRVAGRLHHSRETTPDVPAPSQAESASPMNTPPVSPVSVEHRGTTRAGRDLERASSMSDPSTNVAPQATVRATQDAGMGAATDATAPATADAAAAVVDQVVKSLRVQWKNGIGEARIQLRPEHLGPVDISIKMDGGSITAVVRAESTQVQEWILSHQQSLRQQLEAAGLRLDALVVSPDAERRHAHDEARQHAAHRRRRPAGETPIFEVTV